MIERYVIHVTKLCNMRCLYCYEKDKTSTYTREETLDLCKQIADNNKDARFGIEFLGGEPMLAWDLIQAAYEFFESYCTDRVRDYVITTNGTILTDEQAEYLSHNPKIVYAVSMDGTKWANQCRILKDGRNSYDLCVANIQKAWNHHIPVCVHMVTHHYNVANLYDSIVHLYDLGVHHIGVGTIETTRQIDMSYCDRFVYEMNRVSEDIINGRLAGLHVDILDQLKPKNDVRTYIKDETGKTIGETYGRSKDDITSKDVYRSIRTTSPVEDLIYGLRDCVYQNHQNRIQNATQQRCD